MTDYVTSGRYAKDREEQGRINAREAKNRNAAIRELASSKELEDRIMAIIAARNWYDFQVNDYGNLNLHADYVGTQLAWDIARAIAKHVKTGKLPMIYNPGQPDEPITVP